MVVGETRKRGDIRSGRNGHKTEKSLPIPCILFLPFSSLPSCVVGQWFYILNLHLHRLKLWIISEHFGRIKK